MTLQGYGPRHRPPANDADWMAFAETVADPEVFDAFERAERLGDIATHAFPAGVRRRYDRLAHFPHGLLVIGDAMCNLNPIYGQGMSVAALEAVALQRTLSNGDQQLTKRYFGASRPPIDNAWKLAVGADQSLPELGLHAPLADRVANRYLDRLIAAAEHDHALARIIYEVSAMLAPPKRLLAASTVPRVLRRVGR